MTSKQHKTDAQNAVNIAVWSGRLPYIKSQACEDCGRTAEHYHHESYDPDHWLDVVPLCSSCHRLRHERDRIGNQGKLTDDQVRELRTLLASKGSATVREILEESAVSFDIHITTALAAAQGKTYKWVK